MLITLGGYSQQRLDVITKDNSGATVDSCVQKFTDDSKVGYIYYRGDSIYAKVHDSTFILTSRLQMGVMHLTGGDTTHCTTANTYYKISKVAGFVNGVNNGFTLDYNGRITFIGIKGTDCNFFGSSDVTADKTGELYYALFKNGSLYDDAESPIDINNANKTKGVQINIGIPNLKPTDYFEIWVRSENANTTITHRTLFISFIADR